MRLLLPVLVLLLFPSLAHAKDYPLGFENIETTYRSCSSAKQMSDKEFEGSLCYGHITGFLQGAYYYGYFINTKSKEDPCHSVYEDIYQAIQHKICFPENTSIRKIAMDYVTYTDNHKISDTGNKYPALGTALAEIYKCK